MGNINAAAMAEAVETGDANLGPAIRWHLGSNHFPPIHPSFDASAIWAINTAAIGEWDEVRTLPNGIQLTAADIVEQLHLESFVECVAAMDNVCEHGVDRDQVACDICNERECDEVEAEILGEQS